MRHDAVLVIIRRQLYQIRLPDLFVYQDKATTRQPGSLRGWSGRLKQSLTGHSFAPTGWPKKVSHHQFFKKSH